MKTTVRLVNIGHGLNSLLLLIIHIIFFCPYFYSVHSGFLVSSPITRRDTSSAHVHKPFPLILCAISNRRVQRIVYVLLTQRILRAHHHLSHLSIATRGGTLGGARRGGGQPSWRASLHCVLYTNFACHYNGSRDMPQINLSFLILSVLFIRHNRPYQNRA